MEGWKIFLEKPVMVKGTGFDGEPTQFLRYVVKIGKANSKQKIIDLTKNDLLALQREGKVKQGGEIGYIKIDVYPDRKCLVTRTYFPVYGFESESHPMRRTGLASAIELRVIRDLEKRFPDYRIRSTNRPSYAREKQLWKRKIFAGQEIGIQDAIRRLENYLVKETLRHRAMKKMGRLKHKETIDFGVRRRKARYFVR